MELKEKVAYIKGMMEGMEFDTATKEGKLLAAVVDVLEEMAKEVTNIDEDVDTLYDEVDAMSEDLEDVENFLFDEDGGDEDEDDYDEEYEAGLYEITCPQCGEIWPAPTAARSLRSTSARTTTPAKAVKAAAAARTKNKRIPGTKRRKSPSARRAEGLFCFVGMQGEAQKGEGAPVLFTPVFYRAACVRQYTA